MKLNETQRISGLQNYGNTKHIRAGHTEPSKRKDEISISPEAMELLESERTNESGKTASLDDLRKSVSSGTYHVEAGKIAEKLLPYLK
jgi:negative regulator of flagellin synthesis FlgM